jgi:ribonucleoside-diphosphate reductase alpha chain
MHFYAWQSGLKTGMYYLRTKSAVDAIKFTLNNDKKEQPVAEEVLAAVTEPSIVRQETAAPAVEVQAIDPNEFRAMLERSREANGPEDCEMCGS